MGSTCCKMDGPVQTTTATHCKKAHRTAQPVSPPELIRTVRSDEDLTNLESNKKRMLLRRGQQSGAQSSGTTASIRQRTRLVAGADFSSANSSVTTKMQLSASHASLHHQRSISWGYEYRPETRCDEEDDAGDVDPNVTFIQSMILDTSNRTYASQRAVFRHSTGSRNPLV